MSNGLSHGPQGSLHSLLQGCPQGRMRMHVSYMINEAKFNIEIINELFDINILPNMESSHENMYGNLADKAVKQTNVRR